MRKEDTTTAEEKKTRAYRVLLVVPPFRSIVRPALSVSLLKANLVRAGFAADVLYLNLDLADRLGARRYETLATISEVSLGDFLFSRVRFGHSSDAVNAYIEEVLEGQSRGRGLMKRLGLRDARRDIDALFAAASVFIRDAAIRILAREPSLVGFTSSYQENLACLALAQELKRQRPNVVTVMGGANTQGEMGNVLIESFDEIDYVAQGECDVVFPRMVERLAAGQSPDGIPGIRGRSAPAAVPSACLDRVELEASPPPDFDDYFDQLAAHACARSVAPGLVLETSRGCWWASRERCTFCGLNGHELAFRAKSPERTLEEIRSLSRRHPIREIEVVDNMLNPRHFATVFPELARENRLRFFWETGGRLTRKQVEELKRAGVTHIQPGIESLSDESLTSMNKPTRRLYNIQTLKACAQSGVRVYWNYLCGMPGSDVESDAAELRDIEAVSHLMPPSAAYPVRLQRFSRLFERRRDLPYGAIRPALAVSHLYPLTAERLDRIAFAFESDWTDRFEKSDRFLGLRRVVQRWRRVFPWSILASFSLPGATLILDTRLSRARLLHVLTGDARRVLREAEELTADRTASPEVVDRLVKDRLLVRGPEGMLALPLRGIAGILRPRLAMLYPMPGGHLRRVRRPL